MKYKNLTEHAKNYFIVWSNKDVKKLASFFADEIRLQDWNLLCHGKNDVLDANASIFESVENLDVRVKSLSQVNNRIFAEIVVVANHDEIPVVDIIEFDDQEKITSITAYRGN